MGYQNGTGVNSFLITDITLSWTEDNTYLFSGFSCFENSFDAVLSVSVVPLKAGFFSLGLSSLFHYGQIETTGRELDFAGYLFFVFQSAEPSSLWRFTVTAGYMRKNRTVYAIEPDIPVIRDVFPCIMLEFSRRFTGRLELTAGVGSYEVFRYSAFAQPSFHLSCLYILTSDTAAGFDLYIRYTDLFTLTSYVSGIQTKISLIHHF